MSKFDNYFLMKVEDAIEYVQEKLASINWNKESMQATEIGDGNLNYVFRVWDNSGNSVIVKHAGEALRISAEMKVSTDRNRIESEILQIQDKYAPGLVPKIYCYDTVMSACIMEDLSDHQLMRHALMEHKIFPNFAENITDFMVSTLINTTDVVMDHKQKKAMVGKFINPQLCEITEDLVLMEPFNNINNRNIVFEDNAEFVQNELYSDEVLHLEAAKLKFDFMNNAQALIHGDLHTGSIFVKQDSTIVFDPEFAFYGPMGYDIGNVIANLVFAWDNGYAYNETEFCNWALRTIQEVVDLFIKKFNAVYDANVTEHMAKTKGFKQYYLDSILSDTAGYTGTELARRTVGMAQVKDVTTIKDRKKRAIAERLNILLAKDCIINRYKFKCGKDYTLALENTLKLAEY